MIFLVSSPVSTARMLAVDRLRSGTDEQLIVPVEHDVPAILAVDVRLAQCAHCVGALVAFPHEFERAFELGEARIRNRGATPARMPGQNLAAALHERGASERER